MAKSIVGDLPSSVNPPHYHFCIVSNQERDSLLEQGYREQHILVKSSQQSPLPIMNVLEKKCLALLMNDQSAK